MKDSQVYLDTNVLVYAFVNQDSTKQSKARQVIHSLIEKNNLILSPLSLQELMYVLSRLKVSVEQILQNFNFYIRFSDVIIDNTIIKRATDICKILSNFNDAVHLASAERYCGKIITFDKDFRKFKKSSDLKIDILI